jgi:acetolactate synthase-1/2/3 large subunit
VSLASRCDDVARALADLADVLLAPAAGPVAPLQLPPAPTGKLTPLTVGQSLARHMPEGAIISDDGVTSSGAVMAATSTARAHDVLALTGGAIGIGLPLAIGAAVACPQSKVVAISGDGAAMYTSQALWTMARESLDITVVIFANHSYLILNVEMARTGAGKAGPAAGRLLDLGAPKIDWVALAQSQGVAAERCTTAEEFDDALATAMSGPGPRLIEVAI